MIRSSKLFIAAATAMTLASCASIQSGTTQNIKVSSTPVGATVYVAVQKDGVLVNKVKVGVTPITVNISRKDGAILLEKEGYVATEVALNRTMNPWMWGNILLTSPLSTSIDSSTGAANEYDPGEYMVDMKPVAE